MKFTWQVPPCPSLFAAQSSSHQSPPSHHCTTLAEAQHPGPGRDGHEPTAKVVPVEHAASARGAQHTTTAKSAAAVSSRRLFHRQKVVWEL